MIDKCANTPELVYMMSPTRYVGWNYQNLLKSSKTIEFRKPPGVTNFMEANYWLAVTIGFMNYAVHADCGPMVKYQSEPALDQLWGLIKKGAERIEGMRTALRVQITHAEVSEDILQQKISEYESKKKLKMESPTYLQVMAEKVCIFKLHKTYPQAIQRLTQLP
jgi:hypothetical protein